MVPRAFDADVKEIMERHIMKGEVVDRLLIPDQAPPPALPIETYKPVTPAEYHEICMPADDKWKANMERWPT